MEKGNDGLQGMTERCQGRFSHAEREKAYSNVSPCCLWIVTAETNLLIRMRQNAASGFLRQWQGMWHACGARVVRCPHSNCVEDWFGSPPDSAEGRHLVPHYRKL